jgi:hypothetical protein
MKNDDAIEQKIGQVLASLDNVSKAGTDPFFYTRLSAKLHAQEESSWTKLSEFLARPVVIASLLVAVVTGNVLIFSRHAETTSKTGYAELAQDDYNLQSITYYDPETP